MKRREFFEAVMKIENVDAELVEYARGEIAKIDAENEKRRNTLNKKQKENLELVAKVVAVLTNEPVGAKELGEMVGLTSNKVASLMRVAIEDGLARAVDFGSPKRKGYMRAESVDTADVVEADEAECLY